MSDIVLVAIVGLVGIIGTGIVSPLVLGYLNARARLAEKDADARAQHCPEHSVGKRADEDEICSQPSDVQRARESNAPTGEPARFRREDADEEHKDHCNGHRA